MTTSPFGVPGCLSLVLERTPEALMEPEFVAEVPLVSFGAFASDYRAFGWVRLLADRLTDLVNDHANLRLMNAGIENLVDGRTTIVDEIMVHRDQLIAVQAGGPRGDASLRQRTRTYPLAIQSGSYLIEGFLHATPGLDPLASVRQRPPMIPLTSACVEYWADGHRLRQWVGTIIFNRELADWIEPVAVEELEYGRIVPRPASA